jgi:hypothetical protein
MGALDATAGVLMIFGGAHPSPTSCSSPSRSRVIGADRFLIGHRRPTTHRQPDFGSHATVRTAMTLPHATQRNVIRYGHHVLNLCGRCCS